MWHPTQADRCSITGLTSREWFTEYQLRFSNTPSYTAASAFIAILVVIDAIERAGSIDNDGVMAVLKGDYHLETFFGNITFDANMQNIAAYKVVQYDTSSKSQVVAPFRSQTAQLIYPFPTWKMTECVDSHNCSNAGRCQSDGSCVCDNPALVDEFCILRPTAAFSLNAGQTISIILTVCVVSIGFFIYAKKRCRNAEIDVDENDCGEAPTVFLTHHKQGAGGSARLLKIALLDRNISDIFLDSDNLVDLHSVVPVVAKSKHVMVLITKSIIFRPWCLCEIHTALVHGIPLTLVQINQEEELPSEQKYRDYVAYLFKQVRFRKIFEDHSITEDSLMQVHKTLAESAFLPSASVKTLVVDATSEMFSDQCDTLVNTLPPEVRPNGKLVPRDRSRKKFGVTVNCVCIHEPRQATVARIIKRMIPKLAPGVTVMIPEDTPQGKDGRSLRTEKGQVQKADAVVVLLSKGVLRSASATVRLVEVIKSKKTLIPIIIDPADPDNAFTFPDDTWYLEQLPDLYVQDEATFNEHGVSLDMLAESVREMLMKLAVRFTENESGHAQQASIKTIVDRYFSGVTNTPKTTNMRSKSRVAPTPHET